MFEFHGWIVLRYHTHDTNEYLQDQAYSRFINYLKDIDTEELSNIKRRNGQDSWTISGLHNHFSNYVLEIYKWVSENLQVHMDCYIHRTMKTLKITTSLLSGN
ncbi:hypothetical protein GC093_06755 [Paenibacillus sp. LMG 31456]|uniref:Uncharacterized protein n=1 Tax=Paenibacillus foliorum TaxID=2654974 RepID=A0A972JXX3_9BACL|nr:hypothetical protein [Paenibacillus foliorum]